MPGRNMRTWKRRVLAVGAVAMMSLHIMTSYGETIASDPYRVEDLKEAKDSDTLLLVVGSEGYQVTVSYYKKELVSEKRGPGEPEGSWKQIFVTEGVYGKNGAAADKREGDGKTPLGTYHYTMAFGLKENPGSILPYHQIQKGDYWVDDPESSYYNKLVNTSQTARAWNSAEDMMASAPYYNYGLVLDYNTDCVPGAGSAIFLHCTKSEMDTGSQGCIRIPEELMKQVLQSAGRMSKILIVSDVDQLEYVN